jgi:hypothetical protein
MQKNDFVYIVMMTHQDVRYVLGQPGTYVTIRDEFLSSFSDRKFPIIDFRKEIYNARFFPTSELAINFMTNYKFDEKHYKVLKLGIINEE